MRVYGFERGGIEYEDSSAPQRDRSVIAFLPALSVLPMIQHAGPSARMVVSVGDYIREGMVVGRADAPGSANVHATVPGRVLKTVTYRMSDGRSSDALLVRLEGEFEKLGKRQELFTWNGLSPFELRRTIAEKGIVEMEEGGRPLAELIASVSDKNTDTTVVIRAVFDDPWLAADYAVCSERLEAVVEGAAIVCKASSGKTLLFAVSETEKDLGLKFMEVAERLKVNAQMVLLRARYPQRNTRELSFALRLYEKKEEKVLGSLLCLSASTLAAVYDAIRLNKPLIERYVAVGGSAVKRPTVLRLRIGTRIGDAIAECGGFVEEARRIITGSPLTGSVVADLDAPITKNVSAVVALSADQIGGFSIHECTSCGECRNVCPVGLDPEHLYKLSLFERYDAACADGAKDCHACSCCATVCPSRLPLSAVIRAGAARGSESC